MTFATIGESDLTNSEILGLSRTSVQGRRRAQDAENHPRKRTVREAWAPRFAHYLARPLLQLSPILFGAAVATVIVYAWLIRNEGHWTAESGLGYWLGIAGSTAMLTLVLYPLRKRFRILHGLGRVAGWFRLHMILGILGPTLIVLHCNFKLGSLNSRLALFTMLTVVASGIVGRYLYSQVHKGLYGGRAEISGILTDIETVKTQIGLDLAEGSATYLKLEEFNARNSAQPKSAIGGLWAALTIGGRARRARRLFLREANIAIRDAARREGWTSRQQRDRQALVNVHLRTYLAAVKKVHTLALFERLFALWHVLHMPLFVLLVLTAVIHIVAVHLY